MRTQLSWAHLAARGAAAGCVALAIAAAAAPRATAQQAQGAPPPPVVQPPARVASPIDYTGTWASVVTEDWQWRFVTPIIGDYTGVPLNSDGDKLARAWNHDADLKAGQQCKAFGAAAIMRTPTRLQISWQDDNTMKLDWDLGTQSRLVHFDKGRPEGARTLQGHAIGEWIDLPPPARGGGGGAAAGGAPAPEGGGRGGGATAPAAAGGGAAAPAARAGGAGGARGGGRAGAPPGPRAGGLKIVTTNLTAQYLRQNGVPVSEKAVVTDYLDIVPAPDGSQWLVVKTSVDDPTYLSGWYITSSQFKKEANTSKWNPTPCELLPRLKGTATQVPRQGGD
jgi:hypothetical protein